MQNGCKMHHECMTCNMHEYDICTEQVDATLHLHHRQPVILSVTVVALQLLSCLLLRTVCHDQYAVTMVQYHGHSVFTIPATVGDTQEVAVMDCAAVHTSMSA
jgi:hypothetical protein